MAMPSYDKMVWKTFDVHKMAATHTVIRVSSTHDHYTYIYSSSTMAPMFQWCSNLAVDRLPVWFGLQWVPSQ